MASISWYLCHDGGGGRPHARDVLLAGRENSIIPRDKEVGHKVDLETTC